MKGVLDESVPRDLAKLLHSRGHEVSAFPKEWRGTKNGKLLALVRSGGFDCLLTCDKNLQHQQNIGQSGVALLVLSEQRLHRLTAHLALIAEALEAVRPGEVRVLSLLGPTRR